MTIPSASEPPFAVSAHRTSGHSRLAVSGDVDMDTAPRLEDAVVAEVRDHAPARLVLDLSGVRFLDSSGVRALMFCLDHAAGRDCEFRVAELPHGVRRVLEITGVLPVIDPPRQAVPVSA
jgi:anti-sigma B factor antagonist